MQRLRTVVQSAAIGTGTLGIVALAFAHDPGAAYTLTLLIGLGAAGQAAARRG